MTISDFFRVYRPFNLDYDFFWEEDGVMCWGEGLLEKVTEDPGVSLDEMLVVVFRLAEQDDHVSFPAMFRGRFPSSHLEDFMRLYYTKMDTSDSREGARRIREHATGFIILEITIDQHASYENASGVLYFDDEASAVYYNMIMADVP